MWIVSMCVCVCMSTVRLVKILIEHTQNEFSELPSSLSNFIKIQQEYLIIVLKYSMIFWCITQTLSKSSDLCEKPRFLLVSCGQTLFSHRGDIACSISDPHKKGLVRFTGLTGTDTSRSVNRWLHHTAQLEFFWSGPNGTPFYSHDIFTWNVSDWVPYQ